jgi:short-subunit dehydrogenase
MPSRLKPIHQQVMVITGASSGIGMATARKAAAAGAKLLLIARGEEALQALAEEIHGQGGEVVFRALDVGDAEAVESAAAFAVERFGRIDSWVNNAGVAIYGKVIDTPEDEHQRLFQTNYFGAVHGCRAAVPRLSGDGALITVASVAAEMPSPIMGIYAASKHAVKAYVEALRIELLADGSPLSVSLVKPSGIDTPVAQHAANFVGGEAQVPPPSYAPELVADAILHCATHRVRELTVGGAGRAQVLFAAHFPRLFERLSPLAAKTFIDRDKRQPEPSNLFAPVGDGRVHSGENAPRRTSVYTAAAMHPKATAAGLGLLTAAGLYAWSRRRAA